MGKAARRNTAPTGNTPSVAEFLELSAKAAACASLVSNLLFSVRRINKVADARIGLWLLAREMGDARGRIDKYRDVLCKLGRLSDACALGGKEYSSGHAAAFDLAHEVVSMVWLHAAANMANVPHVWFDPLKAENLRFDPKAGAVVSHGPAPLNPDKLLPDNIDAEKWNNVRESLQRPPWFRFSVDKLTTRIERERPRAVALLWQTAGKSKSEGVGGRDGANAKGKLKPSQAKAFAQHKRAVEQNPELDGSRDRDAYDYVKENLLDERESLPAFATWQRQLRAARKRNEAQKNTPRAGRQSRSVVKQSNL